MQGNYAVPQSPQTTVAVPLLAGQSAGDLNVVIVGWADAVAHTVTVTDSRGNTYQLAVGPTMMAAGGGAAAQSIYYAKNIVAAAAGANSVTVTFSPAAEYADVRVLEYSGIDTANPLDVVANGSGNSASSASASVTTTSATALLVAGNDVWTGTLSAGAGFTQRFNTNPNGDVAMDRVVTSTGSFGADATLFSVGPWVMQMVAFRAAVIAGDTVPPTAPSNLVATATSGSQINLTWTAATDDTAVTGYRVERCQGAACTNFAQVATPTATTLSDTGLMPGTSYRYRVRAADGAANLGPYSGTAGATTLSPDTQAPTAPTALTATATSSTQINLSWTAATDNVGVTTYLVERCQGAGCSSFAQIGTATGTSFASGGLAGGTTYGYRVRATDAASNLGPYSTTATATTQTTPTVPAFVQGNYAVPQSAQAAVAVALPAAQAAGNLNVVIVGWADASAHAITVTDTRGNAYQLAAGPTISTAGGTAGQSFYYAKNIVAGSNTVNVTLSPAADWPDIRVLEYSGIDPANPVDVVTANSGNSATSATLAVTTTNANDMLVAGNDVWTGTTTPGAGFTQRLLTNPNGDIVMDRAVTAVGSYAASAGMHSSGAWVMQMVAFRAAGSVAADTQPPTAPAALTATAASMSQINLGWTAATDNVAVTTYLIERCQGAGCANFAQVGTTAGTTFSDGGLASATAYSYRVRAGDAANNLGPYSGTASATTQTDMIPPSAPTNLAGTALTYNQISLTWTAASDNVGVTGYRIERCQDAGCTDFLQVGTATGTTFSDTLPSGTTYSGTGATFLYRVRGTDASNNLGPYSNTATVNTPAPDLEPPSAPGTAQATAVSANQVNLTWGAATDNVGVTGYLIERCAGSGCTSFAQVGTSAALTFTDNAVSSGTSYSYRVRATDASTLIGPYGNVASATTPVVAANPVFVQSNSAVPQTPQSTVALPFFGMQSNGNLNVVVIGWSDATSQITSVTDTVGNVYTLAVGPTSVAGSATQSIFYARNIMAAGAGGNVVTVRFNAAVPYADVRILEYSGIDPVNPIDVTVVGTGSTNTSSTPAVTTTNAADLLVAGNLVQTGTSGPGTGFTSRMITQPDMDIVEDRVVTVPGAYSAIAPLTGAGPWIMQMVAFRAAGGGAPSNDTTPPAVTVTAPADGASVNGNVTVNVTATDALGVAGVTLTVDGLSLGVPDLVAPYSFTFNSARFANGAHTIGAYAWDAASNIGTAAGASVTFNNGTPSNPAQTGLWSGLLPLPMVPVNVALLPTGKVLMWDGGPWGTDARVWNPATNTVLNVPAPANIFCVGQEQLADGRIFLAGGHPGTCHVGLTAANVFDPVTNSWTILPEMAFPRWYPTTTMLADGRILVVSGETTCKECFATVHEIFNPANNTWTQLANPSTQFSFAYYPHMFLLPDSRVIVTSTTEEPIVSQILNLTTLTWTAVGGPALDGGSATMYAPSKFIKMGTSVDPDDPSTPSAKTTFVLDLTQGTPTWRAVQSMAFSRAYHSSTSLPDGTVLVTGGGTTTASTDVANAVLPAELWSPTTETWTTMAAMNAPRLYHSEAMLMPDGRVLISGGGRADQVTAPTDQFNAEFFSPPYLFKGPRPVITSAPAVLQYGQTFTVQTPNAASIAKVSLIRFGSVTHDINMSQRFLPLSFTAGAGSLNVTAPVNSALAPGGNYLLFVVDTNGVPSVAKITHF